MPQKIVDIMVPGDKENEEIPYNRKTAGKKIKNRPKASKSSFKERGKFSFKIFSNKIFFSFLLSLLGIIIVGIVVWLTSGFYSEASLKLYPKTEKQSFEQEIEVNIKQMAVDSENKIIPGIFFEQEAEKTQAFKTEGRKIIEEKSQGKVKIYNSYNPARQIVLREGTRLLSSEGEKIFKIVGKTVLPPGEYKNGKVFPSIVEVPVIAQEGGEDYNIGASNFSIPGFAGSVFYYSVWGESESPMQGGVREEVVTIQKEDLEKAENVLKTEILKTVKVLLGEKIEKDFVLDENLILAEDFQFSCFGKEGENIEEFSCQAKIKARSLAFKFSEAKEFSLNQVAEEVPSGKTFNSKSLSLEFFPKNLVSESGKVIFRMKSTVEIFERILVQTIPVQVQGKNEKEINDFISANFPSIEKSEINFWPFWINRSPKDIERIEVEMAF